MFIDPAILRAIEAPLPPEPPRVVQERVLLSGLGQAAEKIGSRLTSAYQKQADRWLSELSTVVADYRIVPPGMADRHVMANFDDAIRTYTAVAEMRAKARARLAKRSARDIKAQFKIDPSLGAVTRAIVATLLATEDRIIQALLDYVTFLRAVRAERDPRQELRSIFETGASLRASLSTLIAQA